MSIDIDEAIRLIEVEMRFAMAVPVGAVIALIVALTGHVIVAAVLLAVVWIYLMYLIFYRDRVLHRRLLTVSMKGGS